MSQSWRVRLQAFIDGLKKMFYVARYVRNLSVGAVFAFAMYGLPVASSGQKLQLTLDRILSSPSLTGTSPASPQWSSDSQRLAFLWSDSAKRRREIWMVSRDGTNPKQITDENAAPSGVQQFCWTPAGDSLICLSAGEVWRVDATDGAGEQLTNTGGGKSDLQVSPNGAIASFLQDGDLWLLRLDSNVLTRATKVGVPSIGSVPLGRYNRPDVEIGSYVWGGPTYKWAPNSKTIAVHYVDRREMRIVPFPYYLGKETQLNNLRRGYPGDPNEFRTVGIYDVDSAALRLLELPNPSGNRVVNFSWSSQGVLLIDQESDTAVERWLHTVDPSEGEIDQVWHDQRQTRIYTQIDSAWHADGQRIVLLSDLEDRYGLFVLDPADDSIQRLTGAQSDVVGSPMIHPATRTIFYESNEVSPYETHVFRIDSEGNKSTQLTNLPGQHSAYPSPDGTMVAVLHSNDTTPTELYLVRADGETQEQRITVSPPDEFTRYNWAQPRYVQFPSRVDDFTIHARILEPNDLDRSKKYPVIFGPVYSNTVRNRWGGLYALLQQMLVQRGYIVVQVDVRGSTGYGRAFREAFLMDFAGNDLEDLHSAVEYLATLPYIDTERVGIWGSSYGGTLTLYSLLKKPGLFKAGVACAAAVDPYFFGTDDVAIVRRPESHPEAFARGAAQYAGNLEDHLLLIHGMQDDIVPFKTVVALAEEFMRQGKDFDFAFAPAATHGWTAQPHYARYLLTKLVNHFDRYLEPGANAR